jgi:hypothetical protein
MQRERAMRTLKIFAVAATLLVVIPAVAQEMGGGPIGPGSDRGLQPSYHGGYYYDGYWSDAFWPDRFGDGPISGAVGTAGAIAAPRKPTPLTAPSTIGPMILRRQPTSAQMGDAIRTSRRVVSACSRFRWLSKWKTHSVISMARR